MLDENKITLSDQEYHLLKDLVFDLFGISLPETKRGLIVTRLQSVLKKYNLQSFGEYYDFVQSGNKVERLGELVNKLSTNFTYFYREEKHFEYFSKTALPEVLAKLKLKNQNDLRIWSAGCSSGEEPYTLMMLMMESLGPNYKAWNGGLLATDISEKVLNEAKEALYPPDRLQKLPPHFVDKYFKKEGEFFRVKDIVKQEITFRRFNLMNEQFPFKKPFNMIFCRNVMIYFDKPTRDALVRRYWNALEEGGYLFIGHSETISKEITEFKYVMPALYRKEKK